MKARNNRDPRIDFIANDIYQNNGGTYLVTSDDVTRETFTDGYMVGLKKGPVRVGFDVTPKELDWLIKAQSETPASHIGAWHNTDNGLTYFDIVVNLKSKDVAIFTAKKHTELAIWDCARACELKVTL